MKTREQKIEDWQEFLRKCDACKDGYEEAHIMTPDEWWVKTKNSDWMEWVLRKSLERHPRAFCVKLAIRAAESVADICKSKEGFLAVEAAKNWISSPTEENRIHAAAATATASYSASAYSAAAAAAAASASASAAASAAYAAYAAYAYAAASAAASAAARHRRYEHMQKIIPSIEAILWQ